MKIDANKLVMTACNAFVSATCGALGTYAAHKLMQKTDKTINKIEAENKRKIGFDMRG